MKCLVVGGDSGIGQRLTRSLVRAGHHVQVTTRHDTGTTADRLHLDLAGPASAWPELAADVAILCAAETSLARCAADPLATRRINADAPLELMRRLNARDCFTIFLSTNLVFDGNQPYAAAGHGMAPQTEYGRQKAMVDAEVGSNPQASSLRLGKVIGPATGPFRPWLDALRQRQTIEAFTDMVVAPVPIADVVALLTQMAERLVAGIFHYSASREISYWQAARIMAEQLGVDPNLVLPASRLSAGIAAPNHVVLDCKSLQAAFDTAPPEPETALAALVRAM